MRQLLITIVLLGMFSITYPAHAESYYLNWYTNSYTPPGYLGKALPTKGSTLFVSVIDIQNTVSPTNIIYTWYFNETRFAQGQGLNHTQMIVTQKPGIYPLKVFMRYPGGASNTVTQLVHVASPLVLLTEKNTALYAGVIRPQTLTLDFTATPYFFNVLSLLELDFLWSVGGVSSGDQSPEKPNQAIITIPEETPSNAATTLQVITSNLRNSREEALQKVSIIAP
ncbi:MAG: hypothetical protein HZA36_02005 [Parcubacteria group bacterium]|nr:hypothetical protein [Parcubacteria group bacterium]